MQIVKWWFCMHIIFTLCNDTNSSFLWFTKSTPIWIPSMLSQIEYETKLMSCIWFSMHMMVSIILNSLLPPGCNTFYYQFSRNVIPNSWIRYPKKIEICYPFNWGVVDFRLRNVTVSHVYLVVVKSHKFCFYLHFKKKFIDSQIF